MFGLVVIEVMTPSGHLSNINEINLLDVNFHLRKSLEIFDKRSADKKEGVESALPY